MNRRYFPCLSAMLFLSLSLFFVSCKGEDKVQPIDGSTKKVEYLDATKYDKWVYFSFEKGTEVTPADPAKCLEWDIAFHRQDIRINGSVGYNGKGGLLLTDKTNLSEVTSAKGGEYMSNVMSKIRVKFVMQDPSETKDEDQPVVRKYPIVSKDQKEPYQSYDVDMSKMMEGAAAMYAPRKEVFIVRSAKGDRYYAFKITKTVNAEGRNGGTLSFHYKGIK